VTVAGVSAGTDVLRHCVTLMTSVGRPSNLSLIVVVDAAQGMGGHSYPGPQRR